MRGRDVLQAVYADPQRAEERRERGRRQFSGEQGDEIRRRSTAVRRGVYVPPELEMEWRALKAKRLSSAEAAAVLGLKLDRDLIAQAKRAAKRRKARQKAKR